MKSQRILLVTLLLLMPALVLASGTPITNTPGTTGLGLLKHGFVERSNVQIVNELVNLIVAQRNFQANAQMIQTQDQITQTVINIR